MPTSILDYLEETARRAPDKFAFGDPDEDITFAQLRQGAMAAGTALARKIKPRQPVAFLLEKSCVAIQGMLGAVYAGGFYSIIDLRAPDARAMAILNVLQAQVLVTDRKNEQRAKSLPFTGEILVLEELLETSADGALLSARRAQALDTDPLYVNFTSGSTGVPKGVAVCHRSVLDFIPQFVGLFGIDETDILGNQAPFDFDVSVKDIYSGLSTGAKVQLIPREYFSLPAKLMDYLAEQKVTSLTWAVSAMCFVSVMGGFEYRVPAAVRRVMFSGEVLPIKHLNKWRKYLPDALYVNLYGPTEITCNCTYYVLNKEQEFAKTDSIPIGRAFPNERVFLLDENDAEVTEPGQEGEICVCGTALALGYYGDAERTAGSFVQNPLNAFYPERMYRTGDLGAYREDGELTYIGRKDFQIKHMGQRIELGEIEAQTVAIDGVSRACCLYNAEKKRLLLYYTGTCSENELLEKLQVKLPSFMLPNRLTHLEDLPMNKNGKIDRKALAQIGTGGTRHDG